MILENFDEYISEGSGSDKEVHTEFADYIVKSGKKITIYVDTEEWSSADKARSYVTDWINGKNDEMQKQVMDDLSNGGIKLSGITNKSFDKSNSNDFTITINADYI